MGRGKREYKSPEYDTYHVMRLIAPPGFISHFMKYDACKVRSKQGWHVQVPRLDEKRTIAYLMDEMDHDPRFLTDRLEFDKYSTALGARLVYVIDTETNRLYYWDNESFESTDRYFSQVAMHNHLRRLLRECIKDY